MLNIKEFVRSLTKKENILPFFILLIIILFSFVGYSFFGNNLVGAVWIFSSVLLGALLLFTMMSAGFAVLRSLFLVAAELSLLIFLSQSYCMVPVRSAESDNALKGLLVVGILYMAFTFFKSLYEEIKEYYKKDPNYPKRKRGAINGILFIFFVGLFIWQIYLIVYPIISNLCIYK
jgi:membrane-bound ClpP family serine protease